jgi:tRNA pseudouridine38-40 synthase
MRIALGIEYDGHEFYGWQSQEALRTVQGCLEEALSKVASENISVFCAGRTDAGVHAAGQVIHFTTNAIRELRAWTMGVNSHLPSSISVRWAQAVEEDFHARFSALSRRYRYIIFNSPIRTAILAARVTWFHYHLDAERMQTGLKFLAGEHDFSSFRSSRCEAKTTVRNILQASVIRQNDFVIIELEANAFLHHMVRNITGVLLRIGTGQLEPEAMQEILAARNRRSACETAPATGLYLSEVRYPEKYALPTPPKSLLFF